MFLAIYLEFAKLCERNFEVGRLAVSVPSTLHISYGALEVRQIFARPIKLLHFFPPKTHQRQP